MITGARHIPLSLNIDISLTNMFFTGASVIVINTLAYITRTCKPAIGYVVISYIIYHAQLYQMFFLI